MNYENALGRFFAISFDGQVYEFIVKNNGMMYCDNIVKDIGIKKLFIEPNFCAVLEDDNGCVTSKSLANANGREIYLIKEFDIFPDLVEFLASKDAISYSTNIADLYGLNSEYAWDGQKEVNLHEDTKGKVKILNKTK
ncbi:MAG: hypothetical protein IJ509_03345 [Bacilli bacterium]|nr:hypothetical protein [Bacilli bacterium]